MTIMRKALSRRTVLRGLGAAIALPLVDAMTPAFSRTVEAAASGPQRWQIFYTPNGMTMEQFIPSTAGSAYELTPILQPLAAFRNQMTVITGLAHAQANALGDGSGDHGRATPCWLTGIHPKKTEGYDIQNGISADQIVAREFGKSTQLASLELGIDPPSLMGSCDTGYSCAYTNTLSWRGPASPVPVEVNPRQVFERLFGDGDSTDLPARVARLRRQSSVLDFVLGEVKRLSSDVGPGDRAKLDEYLESVRDVERRIQQAESAQAADPNAGLAIYERPSGIPATFEEHARVMMDLQVLAFQADLTRVISFMLGREVSARSYPEIGVPDAHHPMSHHGNDPEKIAKLTKINVFHMQQLAYLMKRMSETKEGGGTLLDHTLLLGGASIGNPNTHDHMDLPILIAGGGVQGNRHLAVPKGTPMTNLLLSVMGKFGIEQARFGDSTGTLAGLTL